MRLTEESMSWVVYRMTLKGKSSGFGAVCEQDEWDTMEHARPGYHTLVRAGITNEGEAEQLARNCPVDGSVATETAVKQPTIALRMPAKNNPQSTNRILSSPIPNPPLAPFA